MVSLAPPLIAMPLNLPWQLRQRSRSRHRMVRSAASSVQKEKTRRLASAGEADQRFTVLRSPRLVADFFTGMLQESAPGNAAEDTLAAFRWQSPHLGGHIRVVFPRVAWVVKAGRFDGAESLDLPEHKSIESPLDKLKKLSRTAELRWHSGYVALRELFNKACSSLSLESSQPCLYMLRRELASHDAVTQQQKLTDIQKRGQSSATQSVRRYEKHSPHLLDKRLQRSSLW